MPSEQEEINSIVAPSNEMELREGLELGDFTVVNVKALNILVAQWTRQKNELAALRAEVREWMCETCNQVYPGPPAPDFDCVYCPKCQGATAPRLTVELRKSKEQIQSITGVASRSQHRQVELLNTLEKLREENEQLMIRSVGAMAIAENDAGWEKVPVDCPMLEAVRTLREKKDRVYGQLMKLKETIREKNVMNGPEYRDLGHETIQVLNRDVG